MMDKKGISQNIYDTLLFVLILSIPLYRYGTYLRTLDVILTVLYTPFLVEYIYRLASTKLKPYALFFAFWILYSFFSMIWAPKGSHVMVDFGYLIVHTIMFLEILVLSQKSNKPLATISNAWVCALFITSLVGLWEIFTDDHLANARESDVLDVYRRNEIGDTMLKQFAAVTFYNPNTFCWYICFAFPFVLYNLSNARGKVSLLVSVASLFLSVFIMLSNASRGGIITLGIMLIIYVMNVVFVGKSTRSKSLLVSLFVLAIILLANFSDIFDTILFRLEGKSAFEDNVRTLIWVESFQAFLDSKGLGQGIGSMIPVLQNSGVQGTFIFYSHNMILEFLLVYGIFVSAGFIYFFWTLLRRGLKIKNLNKKVVLLAGTIPFPFYSVINSENINPTPVWCFFASLCAFSMIKTESRV